MRQYFVQCIYPVVRCTFPGDIIHDLELNPGVAAAATPHQQAHQPGGVAPFDLHGAMTPRHYKLSVLDGVRFHHPLFCSVFGGPWTAIAEERESCDNQPNHWVLGIPGVPELVLEWYGLWSDRPAVANLTVFDSSLFLRNVSRECCPGFKWCPTTQSCIPFQVNCQGTTPA